jgi:hypothetical protein
LLSPRRERLRGDLGDATLGEHTKQVNPTRQWLTYPALTYRRSKV